MSVWAGRVAGVGWGARTCSWKTPPKSAGLPREERITAALLTFSLSAMSLSCSPSA